MKDVIPSLATDVAGMRKRMQGFGTDEGRAKGLAYRPSPTDVFISPYAKCGTTLLQQIAHGLRTMGDMDFSEITEVVPWLELAHDLDLDIYAPQKAEPRLFKSHLPWSEIPKGGRYIYVIRDPRDVLVSFYHFMEGWTFEPGSISLEAFALEMFLGGTGSGRYWDHVLSWWPKRGDTDTLMLAYEDVVKELPGTVARVARFIGVGTEPERLAVATRQAHIDFMRTHGSHFDDHLVRDKGNARCGLPPDAGSTKVRAGRTGDHRDVLTPRVTEAMERAWREVIQSATGLASYEAMRAELESPASR